VRFLRRFANFRRAGFAVRWIVVILVSLLFLAAAAQTVKVDQFPLAIGMRGERSGRSEAARRRSGPDSNSRWLETSNLAMWSRRMLTGKLSRAMCLRTRSPAWTSSIARGAIAAPVAVSVEAPKPAAAPPMPMVRSTSPEMDRALQTAGAQPARKSAGDRAEIHGAVSGQSRTAVAGRHGGL